MDNTVPDAIANDVIAIATTLIIESGEPYRREVTLNASLEKHLGIDSLGRAELFHRIEKKFAVQLPDRLLAEAETLDDIARYLMTAKPQLKSMKTTSKIIHHNQVIASDPSRSNTLLEVLSLYVQASPTKPHIYFQREDSSEEIITYGQVWQAALSVAAGLQQLGLKEGETVAIMLPTHPHFFYAFFGVLLAGGVPVPIYPPFRLHLLESYAKTEARILSNAEVRVLITFDQAEKLSHLLKSFVPSLKHVTTVPELLKATPLTQHFHATAKQPALIQYTSGSTSDPKGVLLTHQNLLTNIQGYGKAIHVNRDDVTVSWLPLYHDMGLIGMWLGSLYYGIPLILLTPFTFLNHPERWLWAIHYHRGTLSGAPNFAYELCLRKIDAAELEGLDLSSWRIAANGAEKVYPHTLQQFSDKFAAFGFKRSTLLPVYGLAESTVALAIPDNPRDFRLDHIERKRFEENKEALATNDTDALTFVSCGKPIADHAIRIVDEYYQDIPERHVGKLLFRGPSSMQGYYNNPAATQAIYHDGWFDSGDLAYLAEGELFITGRHKDLIIKAGRNLYPAEIEEIVGKLPGIRQGCVTAFGIVDEVKRTEQLVVVAETREKNKAKRASLLAGIQETMANMLDIIPDHIVLVAPHIVPKTSSGKLQRAACKKMYLEGHLSKAQTPPWLQVLKLGSLSLFAKLRDSMQVVAKILYTAYVALLVAIAFLPLYLCARFATRKKTATACRFAAKLILKLAACPITVIGAEKWPRDLPVIFTVNHASYIDSVVTLSLIPTDTRFVGKKELFSAPIIGTFMRKLGYLAVDRLDLSKGIEDTKHIENVLEAGHAVLIFPEGTFGYAKGLRPFRLGAFKIAAEMNIPLCPLALSGTRQILRAESMLLQPSRITVTVCDLVKPLGAEWQHVNQLRNVVRAEIAEHCGEPSLDFIAAQTIAPKHQEKP